MKKNMNRNLEVFSTFVELLKERYSIINETIRIQANVIYTWNGGKSDSDEFLDVYFYLNSMSYGEIQIFDGNKITADVVHTKVESKFNNPVLELSKNNSLVITGNSGKIGGYKIIIIPN
jgi:hypothetical protein